MPSSQERPGPPAPMLRVEGPLTGKQAVIHSELRRFRGGTLAQHGWQDTVQPCAATTSKANTSKQEQGAVDASAGA
eukprot:CAMPEP_0181176494 /NCGR_PEP_ID=MMETSP1096-20121128/4659_1 /TAXON_ID=156174 ORGANISM="Chrysochromulina ericina, Strain CCMP281" /NCGR_SAMPLE_ID=MMETSP1096 /ASSEMBLY_ACC=CAM_ASM_000453 /LENGTH=75 /DNA_ID=CAMNT_0023264585 /DNA_START=543 /DNA_END=771 /DNA_ORIENTATION=+